ncbi:uncharacterized protein LOC135369113 [Ornithodoros turicata]|uniref:uncharacterized protein LOC135369113 n=1 Tax=Ornithodoros turicata TaxID=34597 RepID=UPI003138B5B1
MYGDTDYVELLTDNETKVKVYLPNRFKRLSDEDLEEMRQLPNLQMEKKEGYRNGKKLAYSDIIFTNGKKKLHDEILEWIQQIAPLEMSEENERQHAAATHCNFCKESFAKKQKVRDHDHFFSNEEHFGLVVRKGVFCYSHITDFDVYDEPCLPPREKFFNTLNGVEVSEEDYNHAQNVFEKFQMTSLGEYSDLYLLTDTLLLADVFQNFRKWTLDVHKIEPLHFVSLPGLSMSCALKMSEIQLELIHDPDAYLLIENGLRGGVTQCSLRKATANIPGTEQFDPTQPTRIINYIDVNGLYGSVMRESLPYGGFQWLTKEEIENLDVTRIPHDASIGYFLEVDLLYDPEIHDRHSDLAVAPEKMSFPYDLLSDYQKQLMEKFGLPSKAIEPKLLLTLFNKEKYFLHYRNLQLYMQLGLQVTKVHRVLKFNQKPLLRDYVDFNHELRKNATNTFERQKSKYMINAVFGRFCMQVRKFVDCRLTVTDEQVLKLLRKPNLKQFRALSAHVILFQFSQAVLQMKQPLYLGFTILELSKLKMFDFYHNHLMRVAPDTRLLYMDTDSYIILLSDEKSLLELADDHLDNSAYEQDNPLYSTKNKMVLGKFKNEMPRDHILGFCCLKPKLYALDLCSKKQYNRAKGVKLCEARKLHFSTYTDALEHGTIHRVKQNLIVQKDNVNKSVTVRKIALNPLDTKRYICSDGVETLPFGMTVL